MRTKKQIQKIIKQIEKIWLDFPDLRLCQLIDNSCHYQEDIFYIEDKDLIEQLEHYDRRYKDETKS